MKTLLFVLLLSLSLVASNIDDFAKEMNVERDYNTALIKAKKEKKILIMILSADYCPWCRKFERKTLHSSLIKPRLNTELITLVVDKKYDIDSFPAKFRTQYTPKVFFINPKDESILAHTIGYVKKKDFSLAIDKAKKLYKSVK